MTGTTHRWCSDCSDVTVFEMPPCEDGHGDDCLDLVCVDCGCAVVVGHASDVVLVESAAA
jgi:hypothetical protein